MLENMKLGNKIWLGFGGLLTIAGALGVMSIVAMNGVRTDATALSHEYVPEVIVANDIERDSFLTMYNMRGYQYTADVKQFLEPAQKHLEDVEKNLKAAEDLAAKSEHLVKLKENVVLAKAKATEYKTLMQETESLQKEIEKYRELVDKSAAEFVATEDDYRKDQTKKLLSQISKGEPKLKLEDRLSKISEGTDISELGTEIRIARLKSQTERDSNIFEKVFGNFEQISKKVAHLKNVSVDPANLAQLAKLGTAAENYKQAALKELELEKKQTEVGKKRGAVGNAVLEAAKTTAVTGTEQTSTIAQKSAVALGAATFVMVLGLLAAIGIGLSLAFFVTRSITTAITQIGSALTQASSQVRSASEQLSSAAQQLASSSSEQASAIEETTASLEEMGGMVANNVENVTRSTSLSQRVSQQSETGNETMGRMQESMKEILISNEKIEALVRVIAAIGEKTKVMDEIVFQTKLLSFNASVEAERAGEHGRGFAVVAQEVGNLAQMSGKAAQEIAQILTDSIKNAEVITTENKKKVEIGAELAHETGAALKEILKAAGSVTSSSNQVLEASKEQSSGIKQINTAMSNLEKATQENASLAEEVASTSEELNAQTDLLNNAVSELDRLINGSNGKNGGMNEPYATPQSYASHVSSRSDSTHHGSVTEIAAVRAKKQTRVSQPNVIKKAAGGEFSQAHDSDSQDGWDKL